MIFLRFVFRCIFFTGIIFQFSQPAASQDFLDLEKPLALCRQLTFENEGTYKLASDNDENIFLFKEDGFARAFNSKTGKEIWRFSFGGTLKSNPTISGQRVFALFSNVNNAKSKLKAINKENGIVEWEFEIPIEVSSELLIHEGRIYLASAENQILSLEKNTGNIAWTRKIPGTFRSLKIGSNGTIISLGDNLTIISAENGDILQQIPSDATISAVLFTERSIILGNAKGKITALDLASKKKNWDFTTGGKISSIIETSKGLLISSFDNFIYFFEQGGSGILWKERTLSRNVISPVPFRDFVLITNFGLNMSEIYSLSNGRPLNRIVIEPDNLFLEKPFVSENGIVYPTLRGVYIFKNKENCG